MKVRIFRLDGKTEVEAAGGDNNRKFRVSRKINLEKNGGFLNPGKLHKNKF